MFRKDYHWTWPLPVRVLVTLSKWTFSSLRNSYIITIFEFIFEPSVPHCRCRSQTWNEQNVHILYNSDIAWPTNSSNACKCISWSLIRDASDLVEDLRYDRLAAGTQEWRRRPGSIVIAGWRKYFFVESVIGENKTTCGQTSVNISRQLRRRGWLAMTGVPEIWNKTRVPELWSSALLIRHNAHIDDNQVCIKGVNWCWNAAGLN